MKKLLMFAAKYRFTVLTMLLLFVGLGVYAQPWVQDSTVASFPIKPDFSTPQAAIESLRIYIGSLITIAVGYIPIVRNWANSEKGFKALKIGLAALPVLVVVFIFGFKGDVLQILLNTVWSIVGGLGSYALAVKPIVEIRQASDVQV